MSESLPEYHNPYVLKNFLGLDHCKEIIDFIDSSFDDNNKSAKRKLLRYGMDYRNGHTDGLPDDDFGKMIRMYSNKTAKMIENLYELDEEMFLSTVWFSKQEPNANILRHLDTDSGFQKQYMYSAVFYLNTPKEGGEIVFSRINFSYKPEAGDLIFFESADKRSIHGVNAASEHRYAVPIWFTSDTNFKML